MTRRTASKTAVPPKYIESPSPTATTPPESPPPFIFNKTSSLLSKKMNKTTAPASAANTTATTSATRFNSTVTPQKSLTTISDLKDFASSRFESIKRNSDRSHADILKEIEASQSRLHKRFKFQKQACHKLMDETDKEHRKLSEQIIENQEAMKTSYAEFFTEAQASASRVCKTAIPELSRSFKKSIDALGSRYGIPPT